jgi:hypothetical protein
MQQSAKRNERQRMLDYKLKESKLREPLLRERPRVELQPGKLKLPELRVRG